METVNISGGGLSFRHSSPKITDAEISRGLSAWTGGQNNGPVISGMAAAASHASDHIKWRLAFGGGLFHHERAIKDKPHQSPERGHGPIQS